jgi:hypothetical protein
LCARAVSTLAKYASSARRQGVRTVTNPPGTLARPAPCFTCRGARTAYGVRRDYTAPTTFPCPGCDGRGTQRSGRLIAPLPAPATCLDCGHTRPVLAPHRCPDRSLRFRRASAFGHHDGGAS